MDAVSHLYAEFEALGEREVAERLNASHYHGADLAVAMRWLNEKALARAGVNAAPHESPLDADARRAARAEHRSRVAVACAIVALLIAAGSLGLSLKAFSGYQALQRAAAAAAVPAPATVHP
jgi:hypothetical protein